MRNFDEPKDNYVYKKTFISDGSEFWSVYREGRSEVILKEFPVFLDVLFNGPAYYFHEGHLDDTTWSSIEEIGEIQPVWKRLLTLGFCGLVK